MKRWLIVAFAVVVIISAVGFLLSCGQSSNDVNIGEEKLANTGIIQVPEGPKIKVIYSGPPELEVSWEKLGMATGFQLHLIGTLTNNSDQSVKFSEVAFLLDDEQMAFNYGKTMTPGEKMKIATGFPGYSKHSKILDVRIKDFQKIGAPVTPATQPTPGTNQDGKTFTEAPKNPKSPAEVFALFVFLCNKGDYAGAERLCTESSLASMKRNDELPDRLWEMMSRGLPLTKVVVINENITAGKNNAFVYAAWLFEDSDLPVFTSISKSDLQALMETGPLLIDTKPYEAADKTYTQEVIKERQAEFLKHLGTQPAPVPKGAEKPIKWIKVGEEEKNQKQDTATLRAILYFSNGRSFESNPSFVKESGRWKLRS